MVRYRNEQQCQFRVLNHLARYMDNMYVYYYYETPRLSLEIYPENKFSSISSSPPRIFFRYFHDEILPLLIRGISVESDDVRCMILATEEYIFSTFFQEFHQKHITV